MESVTMLLNDRNNIVQKSRRPVNQLAVHLDRGQQEPGKNDAGQRTEDVPNYSIAMSSVVGPFSTVCEIPEVVSFSYLAGSTFLGGAAGFVSST